MAAWFAPFSDTAKVVYGPVDDAESSLQDRTMQGVSAGVREIVDEFLRGTEGASAIDRGNIAIDIFTNIPDQVDPAVRSRIIERFAIAGAITREDFIDQDFLWWNQYTEVDPKFVNLTPPAGYTHLANQKALEQLSDFYKTYTEPRKASVKELVKQADAKFKRNSEDWFAYFYVQVQKEYPQFTSRDVRNIQMAVSGRVMDFDIPEDWFDHPEKFFRQAFDEKVKILADLRRSNMKGLTFSDVRYQEAVRYLDSYVDILDAGFERQVAERITFLRVLEEGERRFNKSKQEGQS
jgi:hypothetical protein